MFTSSFRHCNQANQSKDAFKDNDMNIKININDLINFSNCNAEKKKNQYLVEILDWTCDSLSADLVAVNCFCLL